MEVKEEGMTKQNRTHSCPQGAYTLRETQITDGISSYRKQLWANITINGQDSESMEEGWSDWGEKYRRFPGCLSW